MLSNIDGLHNIGTGDWGRRIFTTNHTNQHEQKKEEVTTEVHGGESGGTEERRRIFTTDGMELHGEKGRMYAYLLPVRLLSRLILLNGSGRNIPYFALT